MSVWDNVFIILSQWGIDEIYNFIKNYKKTEDELGMLKVEMNKFQETNRTLALMSRDLYKRLCDAGFSEKNPLIDFRIVPYRVNPEHIKDKKSLFLKLPHGMKLSQCRFEITRRLEIMKRFNIIPPDYRLIIPPYSRLRDLHSGKAYINFDHISPDGILCCRLFLHKIRIGNHWILCFWPKEHEENNENKKKFEVKAILTRKDALAKTAEQKQEN